MTTEGLWRPLPAMGDRRPDDIKLTVGRRFRAVRNTLGLSRKQVAKMINVEHSAVSNWEIGVNLLDVIKAAALAQRWGIPLDWFYWGSLAGVRHELAERIKEAFQTLERETVPVRPFSAATSSRSRRGRAQPPEVRRKRRE